MSRKPQPARTPVSSRRSYTAPRDMTWYMADDDLAGIVARAITDAREKGLDDVDQTGHAVRAVLTARPDMTASDALQAVNTWRRG